VALAKGAEVLARGVTHDQDPIVAQRGEF